jgi:16S rRNA (cytidine1402-2'-O)-methyltransferase
MTVNQSGKLYIVATPIGNLDDMVPRAVSTLQSVSLIACEDTRHIKKLLHHFGIDTLCIAYHDHANEKSIDDILQRLSAGDDIALISDAGTPLISDPGYRLVAQARQKNIVVVPVPGACAAIAALSVSGMPTDKFRFFGFLPAKNTQRIKALKGLKTVTETLIFYEAPHRIEATLIDVVDVFGPHREVFFAREITKTYETFIKADAAVLLEQVKADSNQQRGEIVLIVAGCSVTNATLSADSEKLMELLLQELPMTKAASLAAKITGGDKKQFYQLALQMQD